MQIAVFFLISIPRYWSLEVEWLASLLRICYLKKGQFGHLTFFMFLYVLNLFFATNFQWKQGQV